MLVKQFCQQQTKHCVAKKFKALIILQTTPSNLIQVRAMGTCLTGKGWIFEPVSQYIVRWCVHYDE